jgi:FG-GAP-like repeat
MRFAKGLVGVVVGAAAAFGAAPAAASVSFSQSAYTLATYAPSKGVGSAIGSPSYNPQKPVAVGDVNGDGSPDIVVSDYEAGVIYVLLNNGSGSFSSAPGSPFGTECKNPNSVLLGDFNGDGNADVLFECATNTKLELLVGDGHGVLTTSTTTVTGEGPMYVGNIDADTDVVYNNFLSGPCTMDIENFVKPGSLDEYRLCQGGAQEWGSSVHWYSSGCEGDEWLGFAGTVESNRTITVYAGERDDKEHLFACDKAASSEHDSGIPFSDFPSDLATADLNHDAVPDIVTSSIGEHPGFHVIGVFIPFGGGLSAPITIPAASNLSAVGVADFSGDGNLDIAGAEYGPAFNSSNQIVVLEGQASTTSFDPAQTFAFFGDNTVSSYPRLVIADLNRDDKPDIVTNGLACNEAETACSTKITVLINGTPAPAPPGGGSGGGGGGVPHVFIGIKLRGETLVVRKGVVKVRVSCPASATGVCVGRDTLTTIKAFAVAVKHKHKRKHAVVLGSASFSVPAGQTHTLRIKLTSKAQKLLAKNRTLAARETVLAHDSSGQSKTTSATLKLKAARKHAKR